MPKVWNKRKGNPTPPSDAVYVGRPSKWGNPFEIGEYGTREDVIRLYEGVLRFSPRVDELHELKGKDLVCWCSPLPCHADVLLRLANKEDT